MEFLAQHHDLFVLVARIATTAAFLWVLFLMCIHLTNPAIRTLLFIWLGGTIAVLWFFSPLIAAKIALILGLTVGGIACLIIRFNIPRLRSNLIQIEQECEQAIMLTYLQGEMTRAQLEGLSHRLKQAVEPERQEITQSMLKTISPLLMLYLKKEKSIVQWSMAAVGLGKTIFDYFFSENKSEKSKPADAQ